MDTQLLVDSQIVDGQSLVDKLIQDNFDVSVAFWVKASEDGSWQLYVASPEVTPGKSGDAYRKVYYSLDSISVSTLSTLDINLLNDESPIAQAAIKLRDRLPARIPTRYAGKHLGTLPVKEVYIYQKPEIPLRQAFMISYVRQENTNEWTATIQKKEFYRGYKAKGAVSYSTALWAGDKQEDQKFAHIYVLIEVEPGIHESAIMTNPIWVIQMAHHAQVLADELFKQRNPDAIISHTALALAVH